jgi:subtilisin family serine protease
MFNAATIAAVEAGVVVVLAAGNGGETPTPDDACEQSPQSSGAAIVVAASTENDASASFTNFGPCVDLYAPGQNVNSWSNLDGKFATFHFLTAFRY